MNMFANRQEAGKLLAEKLIEEKLENPLILAIPRGGVVIGAEIARELNVDLDVFIAKKIGAPGNPELAIGAVGPDNVVIINHVLAHQVGADGGYLETEIKNLGLEVEERIKKFRQKKPKLTVENKTVVLVDDGIATGATVEVAIEWLRQKRAKTIVLAVPVAPPETIEKLTPLVGKIICLHQPSFFAAVGQFYEEFPQISDEEVLNMLDDGTENKGQKVKIKKSPVIK
ncbi:MAG: phosphoribosyltransferase family protein [bacterium]|nr:phosphoribosyltransferase family protein [bacterium]